jgi:hypothetical protein
VKAETIISPMGESRTVRGFVGIDFIEHYYVSSWPQLSTTFNTGGLKRINKSLGIFFDHA